MYTVHIIMLSTNIVVQQVTYLINENESCLFGQWNMISTYSVTNPVTGVAPSNDAYGGIYRWQKYRYYNLSPVSIK